MTDVSDDACNRTHIALDKELSALDRRLESHTGNITDMKELLVRLSVLQEIALKNQETQQEALAKIDNRILDRTIINENDKKFWESDVGAWVIKGGFVLLALIVLVALGQNVEFIDKIFGK